MNESEKNLIEAWKNYQPPPEPNYIYRIYYNPDTGDCTQADVELLDKPFIVVDKETYYNTILCHYKIVNGELKLKEVKRIDRTLLKLDPDGKFRTIKNCATFLVNDDYVGDVDFWSIDYE